MKEQICETLLHEMVHLYNLQVGVRGGQLSLFQILLSNIAYNVVTEIIYLVGLIAISLIQTIFPIYLFKYITSICIFIILHILFVLLESVSQMYLTFWAKK